MIDGCPRGMKAVSDLNGGLLIGQDSGLHFAGDSDVSWQDAVRPTHGLSALEDWKTFHRIVDRCNGDRYVKSLTCAEQFRGLAFAQLTYRESLRDIEVCLSAQSSKRYHMGFRQEIKRSTLADANETRDWRIHA